jgi:transcriptional regulator with XRE-family HTH domain
LSAEQLSDEVVASGESDAPRAGGTESVGSRIRAERLRQRIGLRELARRVGVSASLISQVELGRATPSVGTLYAIVNELELSLDELFAEANGRRVRARFEEGSGGLQPTGGRNRGQVAEPVVTRAERKAIQLDSGVLWERLTAYTRADIDFLYLTYGVGSESCPASSLMRHTGMEFGFVVRGTLSLTIEFDTYALEPGDSVSFDSTQPHRLYNEGSEPVEAIWFVLGRRGDPRVTPNDER